MIQLDEALVKQIKQKIAGAKKILLIAHKNPDGDTLGSALAMFWYLQGLAKDVDICSSNKPGEGLLFLPGTDQIIHEIDDSRYDLVFSFDTADPKLSGFQDKHPNIYANKERHVNIDHHSSNFLFAGINLVVTDAASTTQVL
ncbi:MAG: DHH family phosphoesterase, partial [bacterium]|nr:DHH family phosphoesterase [bacterium]